MSFLGINWRGRNKTAETAQSTTVNMQLGAMPPAEADTQPMETPSPYSVQKYVLGYKWQGIMARKIEFRNGQLIADGKIVDGTEEKVPGFSSLLKNENMIRQNISLCPEFVPYTSDEDNISETLIFNTPEEASETLIELLTTSKIGRFKLSSENKDMLSRVQVMKANMTPNLSSLDIATAEPVERTKEEQKALEFYKSRLPTDEMVALRLRFER